MNSMIENIAKECFECQVTTKQSKREPVKIVDIPSKPWDTLSIDFGGPYGDGHYNLVAVDKRTRYVEVERVYSTSAKSTTKKLLKIKSWTSSSKSEGMLVLKLWSWQYCHPTIPNLSMRCI